MLAIECSGLGVRFSRGTMRARAVARLRRAMGVRPPGAGGPKELWALRGVSFSLPEGSCLGVFGVNGSGKTTLLRILCGVYAPDEGTVSVHGEVASLLSLGIGMSPMLSGRDNIYLAGALQCLDRREIDACFTEICDFAELDQATIDTPIRYYSAGMRARLSFAISAVTSPDVLLIDEVLSVGDATFRRKSSERLAALTRNARCVVITSHETTFLRKQCDRFLWLDAGRVMGFGDVDVLDQYERYAANRPSTAAATS